MSLETPVLSTHKRKTPPSPTTPKSARDKRIKLQDAASGPQAIAQNSKPPCLLTRFPLEILAEVLSYTGSPKDILALARTSKHFCSVLVNNPGSEFIWRQSRKDCSPPIPDPTPNFTEASYAAFIFDAGVCETCQASCKDMYRSFAIRARICNKPECLAGWLFDQSVSLSSVPPRLHPFFEWMPRTEGTCFNGTQFGADQSFYRRSDYKKAVSDINRAFMSDPTGATYIEEKKKEKEIIAPLLNHAELMIKWREERLVLQRENQKQNNIWMGAVAKREGWKVDEMLQTPHFAGLTRARNAGIERITDADLEAIRPQLEAGILTFREKRQRRTLESDFQGRRKDIQKHYDRVRNTDLLRPLPAFDEFLKLPTMQLMLNNSAAGKHILRELKHVAVVTLLENDLKRWEEGIREKLAETLGFVGWKSSNINKLHPTKRWAARFRCKSCDAAKTKGCFDDKGMGFLDVCQHVCGETKKGGKKKEKWSAEFFEADTKAIQAITQLLEQLGVDPEDPRSLEVEKGVGVKVQCLSCTVPILMTPQMMLSHCRRHESVQFTILTEQEAAELSAELVCSGVREWAMQAGPKGEQIRQNKIFSCRHCVLAAPIQEPEKTMATTAEKEAEQGSQMAPDNLGDQQLEEGEIEDVDAGSSGSRTEGAGDSAKKGKVRGTMRSSWWKERRERTDKVEGPNTLFTFSGFRSHAKTKHGITWIGDEDLVWAGGLSPKKVLG
ncbi:hypothetical protein NLI96_g10489 [Meripilus lineatus]|uniref:F-box domain-containing protein n=1 Tax=Meripilus lineatus TaxID=2056292 RepID=A0AAD5Y992_9APHY|nr:hypothetical protein NLI96_g10489 [Physisporinus lineatus]